MTELLEIKKKLEAIDKKLTSHFRPDIWVKASWIFELTIFDDKRKLERARLQGLIQFRRRAGEVVYSIKSIDPLFLKAKANAPVDNRIVGENV